MISREKKVRLLIEKQDVDEEKSKSEERLERLFDSLGGGGWIKVYRREEGKEVYCGRLDSSEEVCADVETALVELAGGGDYNLKGFSSSKKCVAVASVSIDRRLHPPKERPGERQDAGGLNQAMKELIEQNRRDREYDRIQIEQLRRELQGGGQQSGELFKVMLATMSSERQAMWALLGRNNQPTTPPGDPFSQAKGLIGLVKDVKELGGGDAGEVNRSMAERVLEAPLTRMGERIVDKFMSTETSPTKPPAPAPTVAPPPAGNPQVPAKFRRLTMEEIQNLKTRQTSPPAPPVKEVLPDAVRKKEGT